jgi:pimeloyl-ACP methyl ester carboxylesterase
MSLASKMRALCNDKQAMEVILKDKTSAANWATMRFLDSYGNFAPAIEPEDFDVCPILLTQPDKDTWTPLHLSMLVLEKIKKVKVDIVMLENGGHYPVEEPALTQMREAIIAFTRRNSQ